ncbi:hypothetical protein COO60DRAFT_397617 [Scenedesmus sp. NREL 46B-D3]|nr:hypothetical protein COO60DRAFT_397617 [Scenedesmus sp. NREL 46B-D3]
MCGLIFASHMKCTVADPCCACCCCLWLRTSRLSSKALPTYQTAAKHADEPQATKLSGHHCAVLLLFQCDTLAQVRLDCPGETRQQRGHHLFIIIIIQATASTPLAPRPTAERSLQ